MYAGKRVLVCAGLFASLYLAGCGGSSPAIGVSIASSASTTDGGDVVTLTATVNNDHNSAGVTWGVSGGGSLSNTTTTSATYTAPAATSSSQTVTVTATSVADTSDTATSAITVAAKPAVATTSGSAGVDSQVGAAYSLALQVSGGVAPYTWSVDPLPSCLSLNATTGVVSGTVTVACAGTYTAIFTVTDSGSPTKFTATQQLTIVIAAAPSIVFNDTAAALPGGTFNVAYSQAVGASGGAGALTYAISSGTLPPDLSLNPSAGLIAGTPKAADVGSYSFTVKAVDAYGDSGTQAYTLSVAYPALTVTTGSPLPTGYGSVAYSQALAATGGNGGPYTWSVTSGGSTLATLGLALSSAGALTGTTPVAGSASFTAKAVDSAGNSGTANFTLTVNPALSIATTSPLATGYGNVAYSQTLSATGGSESGYTWSVSAGASTLTALGLSLSSSGALTGTPAAAGGTAAFTAKVTDSVGNTATQAFTLTVDPALTITTAPALPSGYAGTAYSQSLAVTGGSGTGYTWSVTAGGSTLTAAGLSLSSAGALTGSSPVGGTATFTAKVTDSVGNSASVQFTVTVESDLTITTAATLPSGYGNTAYTQTLAVTGGSSTGYTWSVTAGASQLAAIGLNLSGAGVVSGVTPVAGTASFTVQVMDSQSHSASQAFTVTISPALTITTGVVLAQGFAGTAYSQTLAASGGSGSGYTWSVTAGAGSLSAVGLSLSSGGAVAGSSPVAGPANFTAKVTDSAGNTATQSFSVLINAGLAITTSNPLPSGLVNQAYAGVTFVAGGGSGSGYAWTQTAATLPSGMSFNAATAALSGTPSASGSYSISLKVTDGAGNTATGTFTFSIYPVLSFSPTSLPTAYAGTSYTQSLTGSGGSGTGYTFSITSGASSLTSLGLSLSSAGVISGTPTAAGSPSFTVQVKDGAGDTESAAINFTVAAGVTITTTSLPSGYAGTSYSQQLAVTGGTGTGYAWTVTGGAASLASVGLQLNAAGQLSGTPTAGTPAFTVKVTDSGGNSATANLSVTIEAALTIATATLPNGAVGAAYSQTLAATGGSGAGTYTWQVTSGATGSNSLATVGLSVSSAGVVSGSSPTAGTANFTVQVTDSQSHTAQQSYTVTVSTALTITTTTLPAADAGASYSQTLTAAGGSGTGYTWTTTTSNLSSFGLSLSSVGLVSGTASQSGAASFTAKVTDSLGNTATQALSITINPALTLPSNNPPGGYVGVAYNDSIVGGGGSSNANLTISVVSGLPADGVTAAATGGTLTLGGTPASNPPTPPYTVNFTVQLTDSATGNSISQSYSISVTSPTPVSLPSNTTLAAATVNQSYTGENITATGGVPPYTWTVNGNSTSGGGATLGNGTLVATSSGGNTLSISGTPSSTGVVNLNVMVQDSRSTQASNNFTIQVNSNGGQISGQVFLNSNCGGSGSQPIFSVTINTSSPQTVQTDSNGNFSFSGIPAGTYTVTPSLYQAPSGAESLFYPASIPGLAVTNGGSLGSQNFNAEVGYTVSGTVAYTTGGAPQSGQTYLVLSNNNCGGNGGPGTSITDATLNSTGAFTIRGVPPGSYTLLAWMDPLGQGTQNAIDPTGSGSVTVTNANVSDASATMTNPTFATPAENPTISTIIPDAQGAFILPSQLSRNSSGTEDANEYTVEWSTSPALSSGQFTSVAGSHTFTAGGGNKAWILGSAVFNAGLSNGSSTGSFTPGATYYFQAQSLNTLAGTHSSGWSTYGGSNPTAVTIATPACSGCTAVTSSVTIPAGITINSGATLYEGLIECSSSSCNNGPTGIYLTANTSPVSGANDFTIDVPAGSFYAVIGILDQNNTGQIGGVGIVSNVGNSIAGNLTISGSSQAVAGLTLPTANSVATVQTQYDQYTSSSGSSTQYGLTLQVSEGNKLPVAVTLTSGPNLMDPLDMGLCTGCGSDRFEYSVNLPGGTPNVGDTYDFTVTYSDGSQDTGTTVNGAVTQFGSTGAAVGPSDLATNLSPSSTSANTTPTFAWTYPANASDYVYSFSVYQTNCSGSCNNVWQIPGNNSNSNGFTVAEDETYGGTLTTGQLPWGDDPTGGGSSPSGSLSTGGAQYEWNIQVQDSNGNSAQTSVNFTPQ